MNRDPNQPPPERARLDVRRPHPIATLAVIVVIAVVLGIMLVLLFPPATAVAP